MREQLIRPVHKIRRLAVRKPLDCRKELVVVQRRPHCRVSLVLLNLVPRREPFEKHYSIHGGFVFRKRPCILVQDMPPQLNEPAELFRNDWKVRQIKVLHTILPQKVSSSRLFADTQRTRNPHVKSHSSLFWVSYRNLCSSVFYTNSLVHPLLSGNTFFVLDSKNF